MHEYIKILHTIPLFQELDERGFEQLERVAVLQCYRRKSQIFREGEATKSVFFVRSGIIKMVHLDAQGNEQILGYLKKGDMFPHTGFSDHSTYPATAEVIDSAELIEIPFEAFEQLMLSRPTIAVKVMRDMSAKIADLQAKLQDFTAQDVNQRIISFLLRLSRDHGIALDHGIQINLPLTHREFASMVGTSRETVSRLFNQLRKDKVLQIQRKRITILQKEYLEGYR